jgi:SAM-dependent methyltransferase
VTAPGPGPAAAGSGTEGRCCRVCRGSDVEPWREKRGVRIDRCRTCGNAFVPDAAVPEGLEALYAPSYFAGGSETGYPTYLADAPIIERNFARRLRLLGSFVPRGRLLDVGSAYGFFLKVAREAGWEAMGVEIAAECAAAGARLAGVPVLAGDFLEAELPGSFDAVTMFDVLEHMRDPRACLERARRLLAPGGVVVVETGDVASPWARLLGAHWYFLDPPQHLSYFTAAGLARLAEGCGLQVARVARIGRWVSLANVAFKLAHHAPGGALRAAMGRAARAGPRGALYLNFGDSMCLVARAGSAP